MLLPRRLAGDKRLPLAGLMVTVLLFGLFAQGALGVEAAVVDAGFENGADGASLAPAWTIAGAPQNAEYDSARAKNGALSGWIHGPTTLAYAGVGESVSAGMAQDGAELRFWCYLDTANQYRTFDDWAATTGDRAFFMQLASNGNINVYTNRAGSPNGYTTGGYTPVGTYAAGWTEFRIVLNFTTQTYQLSKRANAGDPWTQLKAAAATNYDIPFRGANTITQTHGLLARAYQNTNLWLDDVSYGTDAQQTISASAGPGGSITPSGAIPVAEGADSPVFSITPQAGYAIADVLVDGASVGAVATYQFTAVVGDHTIAASFTSTSNDMTLEGVKCDACHEEHGEFIACEVCHQMADSHPGSTASDLHIDAVVTGCEECHDASLTVEHNGRLTSGGQPIGCTTCHRSTDVAVQTAVAASNSSCSACHAGAGHDADHVWSIGDDALGTTGETCGECHDEDVRTEHAKSTSSSTAAGCDACHPTPRDTLPTWSKDTCVQGGCHPVATATAMHGNMAQAHLLPPSHGGCLGVGCHDELVGQSIADVHAAAVTPSTTMLVDGGFENGVDGATLSSAWIPAGVPQHAEYDSAIAASGLQSAWIQGPTTLGYAGVGERDSAGMAANGAELRFWLYLDTNTQYRTLDDWAAVTGDRAFFIQLSNNGTVYVRTDRAGNPGGYASGTYVPVGTYAVGWTQFRIVLDFASQSYTLSTRTSATDPWTQRKAAQAADFNIPFRGSNTITESHGVLFRAYQNADMWLDDMVYSSTGVVDSGLPRAGCQICHAPGVTATTNCLTCHPDRVLPHGYDTVDHTVTSTCIQTCHVEISGMTDLMPLHEAAIGTTVACSLCHNATYVDAPGFSPWDGTCAACHPASTLHPNAAAAHVGDDITGVYVNPSGSGRSPNGACTDQEGYYSGCHTISDVAALHAPMANGGCPTCHGTGKTAAVVCDTCHPDLDGSGGLYSPYPTDPYDPNAGLAAPGWYHHNNYRYLEDPADQTERPYFFYTGGSYHTQDWPASGYQMGLQDQECREVCHQNSWGSASYGAYPWTTPYEGSYMWYSLPMGDSWPDMSVVPRNMTRTVTVPFGETTMLTFKANWFLEYYVEEYDEIAEEYTYVLQGSDEVAVQVSTDGGATFTTLPGTMGGIPNPVTGNSMGWTDATFDLTPYAGTTIQLRFLYEPDKFGIYNWQPYYPSGLVFDNLAITGSTSGVLFSDGAETIDPGWLDAGWAQNWYRATKAW